MNIEVLDLARQDFDDAFVHYESRRPGLGEELRAAINDQIAKIAKHPDSWMLIRPASENVSATAFLTTSFTNESAMTC